MEIGFKRFDKDWILPLDGTPGNKSHNLFTNREIVKAANFKRPEAVVVPWEYIKAVQNPLDFVMATINRWLPGCKRVYLRSNAPDEDDGRRIPGLYSTDNLGDNVVPDGVVQSVIGSYDTILAKRSRRMRSIPETGMGLLLERAVNDVEADYAGSYTEIPGASKIIFAWPEHLHKTMTSPPKSAYPVANGEILAECSPEERNLARKLSHLVSCLPQVTGKGWEAEFVADKGEIYAEQITPIVMNPRPDFPKGLESVFEIGQVVGTGDYELSGILLLPAFYGTATAIALEKFDETHLNYAVLTDELAINKSVTRGQLFTHLLNARAFLLSDINPYSSSLASHVEQYLRNTGVALEIINRGNISKKWAYTTADTTNSAIEVRHSTLKDLTKPIYSPTKMRIVADEASRKGVVLLNEPWQPFEALKV